MENPYDKLSFNIITACNMIDTLVDNLAKKDNDKEWWKKLMFLHQERQKFEESGNIEDLKTWKKYLCDLKCLFDNAIKDWEKLE
jgi:hypothetical protein